MQFWRNANQTPLNDGAMALSVYLMPCIAFDSIIRIYYVSPIFSYNGQHEKNYLGSR